jgi:hypothetical protein
MPRTFYPAYFMPAHAQGVQRSIPYTMLVSPMGI